MNRMRFLLTTIILLSVVGLVLAEEHKLRLAIDATYIRKWMTNQY